MLDVHGFVNTTSPCNFFIVRRGEVWAPVWYGAVHRSTGFAEPEGGLPKLDGESVSLLEAALPHYERLEALKLAC